MSELEHRVQPILPTQPTPAHDELPAEPPVLAVAHWSEHARPRYVVGAGLVLGAAGFAACLAVTIITRSLPAAIGLGICVLGVIVLRLAVFSADRTTVDLHGSLLEVEHDGALHTIDLASANRIIETRGEPGTKEWRFLAETADGRVIELGPREVDSLALTAAVKYYREVAKGRHGRRDGINWRG